ncbi:DUF977 family protein [Escherichia albertii]|uniref:DUF977 domain-containing protein n=1 Tax=Escherichia albertii TaxID=208962 RepID=A0ABX5HJ61_ESCAL|nr:DUF977 family protein [Escherichia albertii]EJM1769156.1 DUF977 family protein [Escherichia albertii]EJO0119563.1 DUF977 family protein [Escherichia albertii]PFF95231.1 hypothetical protein CRH02_14355 [Escherichia albertii]PSY42659.1 DUF977 domain-containing protein [Escherichia albertii]WDB44058.1 DUF977 family protein [Escherichia albertii]
MAKVFTPEQREQLKARIVVLVQRDGRKTRKQLEDETGATRHLIEVLAKELTVSGTVYGSGHGIFPSEQARKDWIKARKEMSKGTVKKKRDPDLIYTLPDGEIRRYNRRQNVICRECRQSEVMQRVLAFYQGNIQAVA